MRSTAADFASKIDADGLFVLGISLLVLAASFGAGFWLLLLRVCRIARAAPDQVPGFDGTWLVFGKKLDANRPDPEYRARLDRLLDNDFETAVLLGGRTPGTAISEARAGFEYLQSRGLKEQPVHLEQHSLSTLENLRNARALLHGRPAVILSSRYHLCRCRTMASSLGIAHTLCAAEPHPDSGLSVLLKYLLEAFFIHWFLCGKYWATLTRNQRMLRKIT